MNEDLQQQDSIRDEYLRIKSQVEQDNAQIGRQMGLVDQKVAYLQQKRSGLYLQIQTQKALLSKDLNLSSLEDILKSSKSDLKTKQQTLDALKNKFAKAKKEGDSRRGEVLKVEKLLLEKEFEIKDIENEKHIRSQDAKTNQILEELKKRQKGYLGQLYELIKPINAQYDIAVKVALQKTLKFLVVDTPQTAEYCTEFLKEKGLFKDVLVLQNVPERALNQKLAKDLKGSDAHLVFDVIEVSRRHNLLERALRYFLSDKLVVPDFDTATRLQRSIGAKDLVTLDGTEFKHGMISGGTHSSNLFAVNLG